MEQNTHLKDIEKLSATVDDLDDGLQLQSTIQLRTIEVTAKPMERTICSTRYAPRNKSLV